MKVTMQIIIEIGDNEIELSYEEGKKLYEQLKSIYGEKVNPFKLPDPLPWEPLRNPWQPIVTYRFKVDDNTSDWTK